MSEKKPDLDIYLVIGLTKESRHWSAEFVHELQSQLSPKHIHLVDLPGAGQYLNQSSPVSISTIVDRARERQTFHADRKRLVVAISLGGMVAWDWTTRYPEDFHGFVMINSSLAGLSSMFKRLQPMAFIEFLKIAATPAGEKKERRILDLCSNNADKSQKILPRWVELSEATMHFPNVLKQFIAAGTFRATSKPTLPILVIAAKNDRLAHHSCSKDIANFTNATFILNEDPSIGHAFHVDGPDVLSHEIKRWILNTL